MARGTVALIAALAAAALAPLALADVYAEPHKTQDWSQMAAFNGQWNIGIATSKLGAAFTPITCPIGTQMPPIVSNATVTCTPALVNRVNAATEPYDEVMVTISLKNATKGLQYFQGVGPPAKIVVQLCFSEASQAGRKWRKHADLISYDKACPYKVGTIAWSAAGSALLAGGAKSVQSNFVNIQPTSVYGVRIKVLCNDNTTELAVCQWDWTLKGNDGVPNYFGLYGINPVPPKMIVAAAVASVFGPIFLIVFFSFDSWSKSKTVKAMGK